MQYLVRMQILMLFSFEILLFQRDAVLVGLLFFGHNWLRNET